MDKQQAIERLDALEAEAKKLREIINTPGITPEQRFWELILQTDSIKIDKEKYPDSTFGFIGEKFLWEYDSKSRILWLSYNMVWGVLEAEFELGYNEVQALVKKGVEEHFKCKGVTPQPAYAPFKPRVEEHFKRTK